ncbi:MAG: Rieske (2Fe-2S) protein [Mariniphaga sp.]|jgi:Rieske Fe-S protein
MEKQKQLSRKIFIRWTAGLSFGFAIWIWHLLSNFQNAKENRLEYRHSKDIPQGVSYYAKYYLFRKGNTIRAFSTSCTHAGCRIGKGNGNTLQCNCHGSQFEGENGKPIKGPAIKQLQEFVCRFDDKSDQWIVQLHSAVESNA